MTYDWIVQPLQMGTWVMSATCSTTTTNKGKYKRVGLTLAPAHGLTPAHSTVVHQQAQTFPDPRRYPCSKKKAVFCRLLKDRGLFPRTYSRGEGRSAVLPKRMNAMNTRLLRIPRCETQPAACSEMAVAPEKPTRFIARPLGISSWERLAKHAEFDPGKMADLCLISLRQLERILAG
jgi:hypothetical protein